MSDESQTETPPTTEQDDNPGLNLFAPGAREALAKMEGREIPAPPEEEFSEERRLRRELTLEFISQGITNQDELRQAVADALRLVIEG